MPPDPIDNPELFDAIVLAGKRSPGVVTISGHDDVVKWDVKSGSGQKGASTELKEIPLREFTCSFYLVKNEAEGVDDYADFEDFRAVINATVAGGTPKAVDIYHPDLAAQRIKSVCKASIGGPVYDKKGGKTVAVKFQEYRPPQPKGGAPTGSKTKDPKKPDPDAALLEQLDALTKQYQETPWG